MFFNTGNKKLTNRMKKSKLKSNINQILKSIKTIENNFLFYH